MRRSTFYFTIVLVLITYLGCYFVALDNQLGERSLGFLTDPIMALSAYGMYFTTAAYEWIPKAIAAMCVVLALLGIRRKTFASNLYFSALIAGLVSEYFLVVVRMPLFGAVGYGLSFLFLVLATLKQRPLDPILDDLQRSNDFTSKDAVLLGVVTVTGLIFRMYGLNQNFDSFEGELASYSASATSIPGMFLANQGYGWWAPLGILYYLPIYLTTNLFGVTLVSLRLSSAVVGIFTIPFLYFLGRRIAGRDAALIGAVLLALNHQHIGWGRTDIHPHGVTTWPTLMLCLAFLRACETRRVIDFIFVALAMGLTWHQYPSGQSAVIIPFIASALYFVFNRGRLPFRWYHSLWLLLGAALWFIGLPLSYYYPKGEIVLANPFNLTGPRALWGGMDGEQGALNRVLAVVQIALQHLWDVIEAIFYRARHLFHQDFIAEVPEMYPRTLPWMMTPFMFAGLIMLIRSAYRLEVAVLLSWVIAAILPGILSEQAYPKRLSTLFPALDLITAIGVVFALSYLRMGNRGWRRFVASCSLSAALFGYGVFECRQWFSGLRYHYKEPAEIHAADEIASRIKPNSIVIGELSLGYYTGKMTYLLLDHLTSPERRPNIWFTAPRERIRDYIDNPMLALRFQDTWVYQCTKLRELTDEAASTRAWERVVFVLQMKPLNEDDNRADIELATQRCLNPEVHEIPSDGVTFWIPLKVISCELSDLKPNEGTLPEALGL